MKKRFLLLFFVTIYFLVPLSIGFVIGGNQFSNNLPKINIGIQAEAEDKIINPIDIDENVKINNQQVKEKIESNQGQNELTKDKKLDSLKKAMEQPEAIETLVSLSEQLDDVNISLQSNNQKEMVSLVQRSLTAYINQEESYKQDISKAVDIYNKMTTDEQRQIKNIILSNVKVSELLFLKKAFGF